MNEHIYRDALTEFTTLSLDGKKEKLLELITSFGNSHPVFGEITSDIQTSEYTDEQYIDIYKIVLKSMYEVEVEWLTAAVKRIEQLHEFLVQLRMKEADENKKAGDIDARLAKVLATLQ